GQNGRQIIFDGIVISEQRRRARNRGGRGLHVAGFLQAHAHVGGDIQIAAVGLFKGARRNRGLRFVAVQADGSSLHGADPDVFLAVQSEEEIKRRVNEEIGSRSRLKRGGKSAESQSHFGSGGRRRNVEQGDFLAVGAQRIGVI